MSRKYECPFRVCRFCVHLCAIIKSVEKKLYKQKKKGLFDMKKTAAFLLAALLMLSCTACVTQEPQAATAASTTQPTETTVETTEAPTKATEPEVQAVAETLSKDDVPVHVTSKDGLVELDLPNQRWAELHSDEHTLLFSDGDCAITLDLYKKTDTLPSIPLSDETHKLIFTSTVSVNDYVLFITGYAHEEEDFSPIGVAIKSIVINKSKVPQAMEEDSHSYTIQDTSYDAWVTASALNVRSASGTDASVIASLPKGTKVTVTGEVLESGRYIGWSRIKMSNGTVGFVASQFLTSSQPKAEAQRTGTTKTLWNSRGTAYTLYAYSDGYWRTNDGTVYWTNGSSSWINSAGIVLYEYDPTYQPVTPAAPTKTGSSAQLWDSTGIDVTVYFYSDNVWRSGSGAIFWPDGFSTWGCNNGRTYYDYDPTYVEPTETDPAAPDDSWKDQFENSLYGHDGMIACWYTYLGDGWYEVYCQDPDNADLNGTVHVNAYTGSWNWV